jgi:type IV secretory pathway VirB6-like protein
MKVHQLAVLLIVGLLLIVFPASSFAQSSPSVTTNAAPALQALGSVVSSMENMLKGMVQNNGAARQLGLQLLGFFVLLNVAWALVKGMATGRMLDYMIGEFLPIGIAGVVAWMFLGQVSNVSDLGTAVQDFMNAFGNAVAPNIYKGGASVTEIISDSVTGSFTVIANLFYLKMSTTTTGFWDISTGGFGLVLISALLKVLTIVIVFLIVVCTLGAFIGTIIFTQMAMYLALIVMPVFIPFMVFRPLESYFDRWLSFFVSSIMAKIIGSLIIQITNNVMTNMVTVSETMPSAKEGLEALVVDIVVYVTLILMSVICYMMVSRIDSISKGLTGSIIFGFAGFGRELSGGMGGIQGLSNVGKGGGPSGAPTKLNATSAITAQMPVIAKPITNALGNAISARQGRQAFAKDMQSQNELNRFEGPHRAGQETVTRDLSKMPLKTAEAYRAAAAKAQTANVSTGNGTGAQRMPTTVKKTSTQ